MAFADNLQKLQDSLQDFDVNDIYFENVGGWPMPIKVASWVITFAVCVFGGYKFDIEDIVKIRGKFSPAYEGTVDGFHIFFA